VRNRQVYFPYRSWGEKAQWTKSVRPLYITFDERSNDYVVRELGFRGRDVWQSIYEVRQDAFHMEVEAPEKRVLDLSASELQDERIPQADKIARIAEFPVAVARGVTDSTVIAEFFQVHKRQSSYYRDAVQSLGLVRLEGHKYSLTPEGQRYIDLAPQAQADWLARRMSRLPVVREILVELEKRGATGLPVKDISGILMVYAKEHNQELNLTTANRRRSTLRAYIDYIGSRTGAIVKQSGVYRLRENVTDLDAFSETRT
jgi:hypothetical protein